MNPKHELHENWDGEIAHYDGGVLHRDDGGPARIRPSGLSEWYFRGRRHSYNGPAVIRPDGKKQYWIHGVQISKTEYDDLIGSHLHDPDADIYLHKAARRIQVMARLREIYKEFSDVVDRDFIAQVLVLEAISEIHEE